MSIFNVVYLLMIVNTSVGNISHFQLLMEVGNSDRQAHSIISFQQEIMEWNWLLVHVQYATGICSGMHEIYFSFIPFPLETGFKVRQDRPR